MSAAYEHDEPDITRLVGGGRKFTYALDGPGSDPEFITINEPPAGFAPLSASDAELRRYGFPPRPSNAGGLEAWRELVGGYRDSAPPVGCQQTGVERKYLGEDFNPNWGGYEVTAPGQTDKWHAVIGTFYQPSAGPSCLPWARVASWVGLGGSNTGRFIQTGTEVTASGQYNAWIEIWAGNYNFSYEIPAFKVEGTNYIRLYAGYNTSLQVAHFYITNDHTGQTVLTEWHIGSQFYDGSSAEWIDEPPYSQNGQYPLMNFGQINWFANRVQNGNNEILSIDSANYLKDVIRHGDHNLAWPGNLWNHENYTHYFYSCQ